MTPPYHTCRHDAGGARRTDRNAAANAHPEVDVVPTSCSDALFGDQFVRTELFFGLSRPTEEPSCVSF